jgi:two-component system response regulator GlrR
MADIRCQLVVTDNRLATQANEVSEAIAALGQFSVLRGAPGEAAHAHVVMWIAAGAAVDSTARLISAVRRRAPGCPILVAAPAADLPALAPLLDAGASDFIALPLRTAELELRLRRALGTGQNAAAAARRAGLDPRLHGLVGNAPAFVEALSQIPRIANCNAGVLLLGETGTGKELFAQAVHDLSPRASCACVAVNCGAIPVELVESELFGHAKGAFTTANTAREGLVAEAEGGTLFLDDVDCLPLVAQAKLLRFLQQHEYRAVGSNATRRADVRVLAAANEQLPSKVARGEFRQDLYFRLNVLSLRLPPLRERREDIAELAAYFVQRFAQQAGAGVRGLAPPALQRLIAHDWPGNVRELEHVIERAVVMASGPLITDAQLNGCDLATGPTPDLSFRAAKAQAVQQFERGMIEGLLRAHGGNVTHAARAASKNRRAFVALMRKYEIDSGGYRTAT